MTRTQENWREWSARERGRTDGSLDRRIADADLASDAYWIGWREGTQMRQMRITERTLAACEISPEALRAIEEGSR